MSVSPMFVGQLMDPFQPTLYKSDGTPRDLTGINGTNISLIITDQKTGAQRTGAGTWTIVDTQNGIVSYQWATADTATAGSYSLQVIVTFAGSRPLYYQPVPWTVLQVGDLNT